MDARIACLHTKTPELTVLDARGLIIRNVNYYRHPATLGNTETRITRHEYNQRGFLTSTIDPRLHLLQQSDKTIKPNFSFITSLTGSVSATSSLDAGTTVTLNDAAKRPALVKNANGVTRIWSYEEGNLAGRPLQITELPDSGEALITERFVWATNTQMQKDFNVAGQCIRYYDTAGLTELESLTITRIKDSVIRQFLPVDTEANWQGEDEHAWQNQLHEDRFNEFSQIDATGATLISVDAKGHMQQVVYDISGQPRRRMLTLKDGEQKIISKAIEWSALGQKLSEKHGNGVISTFFYDLGNSRLISAKTERPAGHALGHKVFQSFNYTYDAVGNLLSSVNIALSRRFWRNQKIEPTNIYTYDTCYQLVSAQGREMTKAARKTHIPRPIIPIPEDNSAFTNYMRTYTYDAAANLRRIRHQSPATGNNYTTDITVSDRSNRAVLSELAATPDAVDNLFDPGGHQLKLDLGRLPNWNRRGELGSVNMVAGKHTTASGERYRYDANSQRVIKLTTHPTGSSTKVQTSIYLQNLELRNTKAGARQTDLQIIKISAATDEAIQVCHWVQGKPDDINNDLLCYTYSSLANSHQLEVDEQGKLISQEEYYPYGGTAVWAARSQTEAELKTLRYSRKELDASGLYYFGYRYYQSSVGRWLSADPAGPTDGLNIFTMSKNNPCSYTDANGLETTKEQAAQKLVNATRARWATRSLQRMEKKGALLKSNLLTNSGGLLSEIAMSALEVFKLWSFGENRDLTDIAHKNTQQLKTLLNPQEQDFFEHFVTQDFYLTHATNARLENNKNDINIYSRKMLTEKNIQFYESNSTNADITGLGNDDYAFFSIEVGIAPAKTTSRFGKNLYKVAFTDEKFKNASMSVLDQLDLEFPEPKVAGLSDQSKKILQNRTSPNRIDVFFNGREDSINSLAYSIIHASRLVPKEDASIILSSRSPVELNRLISSLFRPEVRIPHMMGAQFGDYFKFTFGNH